MKKLNTLNRTAFEAATGVLKAVYPELSSEEITKGLLRLDEEQSPQVPIQSHPQAYTLKEAAQMTRLSRRTLCRYIKSGTLKAIRVGPRAVRIPREAIEELFLAKEVK